MSIQTQNDLINARANKRQAFSIQKATIASQTAGTLVSMYRSSGPIPAQPAIPAAAALCTKALTWNFNNPAGVDKTYLDVMDVGCSAVGRVTWYDRLFHIGGLSGTVTTAQAVNSQLLLTFPYRGTEMAEAQWFLEWYTATGATGVTANVAVTYDDDSTATIPVTLGTSRPAGFLAPIIPTTAVRIIKSVQTVTLSGSTGTAGNFGVTCADRKTGWSASIILANTGKDREAVLSEVPNDACIWPVLEVAGTSTGDLRGEFSLIQG